ncbi:MAG: phosphotransferase [Thermoleophilaceae bacterium]
MIRQSIPEDKALPQMPRMLDVEAMAPVLEGMLEESTVAAVRISYLRYRPGRRLLVCYDVETAEMVHQAVAVAKVGVDLAAQASDRRNASLVRKAGRRSPARTPLAYDPGLDALIQWSPVDIELPALAEQPERLRDELLQAGLEIEDDELPQLVKHKPLNRAVMRLNRHFVKIYADANAFAGSVHATHKAASLPVCTASCEAIVPDLRMAAQSMVPGSPPVEGAGVAPQAGALLAVIHSARVSGLPLEPPADQLDDAVGDAELVSVLVPSLEARVTRLMSTLELDMPEDSLVPSHGGFRRSQLLESDSDLGVIDFDGFCRSPAARDLASFTAAIVEEPDDLPKAAAALDVLADAYGRRPPGLTWYLTTYLLRRTRRPFTRLEEGWPDAIEERVRAAELALEF